MFDQLAGQYSLNLYGFPVLICGFLILFLGLFILVKNVRSQINFSFFLSCFTISIWLLGITMVYFSRDESTAFFWGKVLWTGLVFIGSSIYFLTLSLTKRAQERRKTLLMNFAVSGIFCIAVLTTDRFINGVWKYSWGYYPKAALLYYIYLPFFFGQMLVSLFNFYVAYRRSDNAAARQQIRLVFIAFGIAYTASVDYLPNLGYGIYPFGYFPMLLFTAIIFYSIVRYKLWDISTVVHKTAMWAVMSSLVILPVGAIFYFGHGWIDHLNPTGLSLLATSIVLLLVPYIKMVQPRIDHLFQRRKHDLQKILQDFIHEIVVLKGLNELVNKLQATITSVLYPEGTSVILLDVKSETLKPFLVSGLSEAFTVERHPDFLEWLERTKGLAELDLIEADPRYAQIKDPAKEYFKAVAGKLAVPLTHDGKLLGVINLGQKKNLKPYTGLDLDFLSNLKVEASIAFSNALLYDDVSNMSKELKQWATELEHKVEERTKELAESKQEVERAYAKLKELDAIKTQFFSNISHELRTPLTLVLAPLESMIKGEMGAMPTAQQGHMEIMYQNSLRLLKMINNLLDLAKIDAGKMKLTLDYVNLPQFINGIVASVSPMAEKKQIRLSFVNGDALPELVCDKEKIERVLLNLIFNSLKFTEPGGTVTVRCAEARSRERDGHDNPVMVSVSDTGIGFPKEYSTRIFERFSQVDASASRKHEGTGIGLALAKELVELHRGRIWADSAPGKGTVMTFTLPMDLKPSEPEGTAEDPRAERRRARERRESEGRRAEDWTKALHTAAEYSATDILKEGVAVTTSTPAESQPPERTVLLIEDNADMRSFIAFQLQNEFNLIQARDGIEGVGLATQHRPDLIISDVMMPGKDGYQVCREIKSDPHTKHIPVILLTAKAELSEKISGLEYGADDYLTKPFNAQELKAKIRSLIQLRRLEREIQNRSEELERTLKMLQETQTQLVHSEKMAALGLLVAGIAHEVNNPVSFAKGSLSNLRRYLGQVREALEKQPETRQVLVQFNKLLQDIEQSLNIVKAGLDRTEGIVTDLKTFARKDEQYTKRVDIQEGLEATIKLIQHEIVERIALHRDYGIREPVEIIPGQINQVFMNLLQNAIHAIPEKGEIWIRSWEDGDWVHISVRDSGKGIRKEHLGRIFEPFFTTKEVGQGTGLGLSVSYRIIENHGGKITVSSEEGKGAEFVITLPKRGLPDRPATKISPEPVSAKGDAR